MSTTLYLKCSPDDVAERILLVGDPARVDRIAERLDAVRVVGRNREYYVVTGTYAGESVSAVSAGIGAPSTAIALEELARLGARAVVRVGTMMSVAAAAPMGTLVVPTGALRYDGTSPRYLPIEVPAVPDWRLAQQLYAQATTAGMPTRRGLCASFDAFYPDMAPDLADRTTPTSVSSALEAAGALSLDMESSLLFVAGRALGLAVATIGLITVAAGTPPTFMAPEERAEQEGRLIDAALDGIVAYTS